MSDGALVDLLASLAAAALDGLYERAPWAVLASFRACDAVGKQLVVRLAHADGRVISRVDIERWCVDDARGAWAVERALVRLRRVRAIEDADGGGGGGGGHIGNFCLELPPRRE